MSKVKKTTMTAVKDLDKATKEPCDTRVISRFPFDGGNRFLKYFGQGETVEYLPSCIKEIESWDDFEGDAETVRIDYQGRVFAIGKEAQALGGSYPFQNTLSKGQWAKQLLLACLEPSEAKGSILIKTLAVTTPDTRKESETKHLQDLVGDYNFKHNGVSMFARVENVEIIEECESAWRYALHNGGYSWTDMNNAVIDLGGGTSLARIFTPDGRVIRKADLILPGTFDLAKTLASALQKNQEFAINEAKIMDAIADGSYCVGSTANFSAYFDKCRNNWIDGIRGRLRTAWATQLTELGEVLIVGGSAELARPFAETTGGRFKIPQDPVPQCISLYGLLEGK